MNVAVPKINTLLSNEVVKVLNNEIDKSFNKISTNYNINHNEIDCLKPDINKICTILGIKKRIRRSLPEELMCMGRKLDGKQCTRSRRNGTEYCLSHEKSLPNGRFDDKNYEQPKKGVRGRKKRSGNLDTSEYIATKIREINGQKFLIDSENNVYLHNIEQPTKIGIFKNNSIEYFKKSISN